MVSTKSPKYIVTFWNGFDNQAEELESVRKVIEFLLSLTPDFRERCSVYEIEKSISKDTFLRKIDGNSLLGFNP